MVAYCYNHKTAGMEPTCKEMIEKEKRASATGMTMCYTATAADLAEEKRVIEKFYIDHVSTAAAAAAIVDEVGNYGSETYS